MPYVAPERFLSKLASKDRLTRQQSDIFSYGIVMWEASTDAKMPYGDCDDLVCAKVSRDNQLQYVGKLPADIPQVLGDIVYECLEGEPQRRPSLDLVQKSLNEYLSVTVLYR